MASRKAADPHVNRLLGLLPPRDYERLRPHLQHIPLKYRQSLYRDHTPIGFVYFIETGVGSLVNTMANGEAAEVGTIGNEGIGSRITGANNGCKCFSHNVRAREVYRQSACGALQTASGSRTPRP